MRAGPITSPSPATSSPDPAAERSPAPLTHGPTSTAPTTPQPRQASGEHGGQLRTRFGNAGVMVSSMARRVKLPEAANAVSNTRLARGTVAMAKDVLAPAVALTGDVLSAVGKAARQST